MQSEEARQVAEHMLDKMMGEIDQIKEEIIDGAQKHQATTTMANNDGPSIPKKKLRELI